VPKIKTDFINVGLYGFDQSLLSLLGSLLSRV